MALTLKLQVPSSDGNSRLLPVDYDNQYVIRVIRNSGSPYVRRPRNDVIVKDFFGDLNRVPDDNRYHIGNAECCESHDKKYRICNDKYLIPHCNIPESSRQIQQQSGSVVLLLESPHECEYEYIYRCFVRPFARPKGPARGDSGKNIDQCLSTVLLYIQRETGLIVPNCHIVISNPIQFQTSLHAIHGKSLRADGGKWETLRNNVWRTLWDDEEGHIKQCFRARLDCYYPKVIINACTSDLKPRVKTFVEGWIAERRQAERRQIVHLYEIYHPSYWHNLRPERIIPQAEQ